MDQKEIMHLLRTSDLGIDNTTLEQTVAFLNEHVGTLDPVEPKYQIMAAAAIVGETIVLDDITNTRRAKSGITLERVMRHIGALSKEQYLEVLSKQVEKWRNAPLWLKAKSENLKITYRIYKKYRTVLEQLTTACPLFDEKGGFSLMATFWLVFLFVKNQNSQFDNTLASTSLLHAVVVFAFSEVAAQMPHHKSSSQFRRQFPESKLPTGSEWEELRNLIMNKLTEVHAYRYDVKPMELEQLTTNPSYQQRFLDDLSNLYEKFRLTLPENIIDQHSFLELTKNIAPQPIRRMVPETNGCIQKRIDFTKSDDQDEQMQNQDQPPSNIQNFLFSASKNSFGNKPLKEEPRSIPLSPVRLETSLGGATPVTARHRNLSWVNNIISGKFVEEEAVRVQQIYQKYAKKDYGNYRIKALSCINDAIVTFTPDCMDVPRRQRSIYHFFQFFINRIAESHGEIQLAGIVGEDLNINSILCLSCQIFNFAYHSLSGAYRSYCKIFGVTLLQGYKPINWFGKHVKMPRNIEDYLYDLQRRILIEELWQDNQGYQLLIDYEEINKYHNQAVLKRLHKHANQRTQELCQMMKIGQKQIMRIVNLVKLILDRRPILLKNHRIDQMVVCSIASTLSINYSSFKLSLQQIFENYNKLILSFNANRHSLFDCEGNKIGLVDFYNMIFLPCVEELLKDQDNHNFLATPVRLERSRAKISGMEMTPIPIKFRQPPALNIPSKQLTLNTSQMRNRHENQWGLTNTYRYELASSLKNLQEFPEEKDEEEMEQSPSPTFGGSKVPDIYKTFSFGDRDGNL